MKREDTWVIDLSLRDEVCLRSGRMLEGQANNLPATFAPEEFIEIVPEEITNPSRVLAHLNDGKLLQTNHQSHLCRPATIFLRRA